MKSTGNSGSKWSKRAGQSIILGLFLIVVFADFIAPYDPASQSRTESAAPPTTVRFFDADGKFSLRPFIYRRVLVDPLNRRFEEDTSQAYPLDLFVRGEPYSALGLFPASIRLFGIASNEAGVPRVSLLGTDRLGRDRFSRLLSGIRFSLIVCPIGGLLAWLIGVSVGLLSGYSARMIDSALMGITDTMLALPTLILVLAARAAFPLELPPLRVAGLLLLIFALTGWAEMARITRGLVKGLKEREYVLAARSLGLSEPRILIRHIFPNALPTLLTQGLAILPYFLLSEVALSFLGVGLQEPAASLGNLLAEASDINQLRRSPVVLLMPGFVIMAFVLAFRLVGRSSRQLETPG